MSTIKSICVYCAASPGTNPAFVQAATKFGRILAEHRIRLVYGGGSVGLMGALAESVLDHGGSVTGVIPDFLVNREHMLLRVQERVITRDMHERKRVMFERADAFVGLPGGVGTLEELIEQLTWAQLGRHKKPILILNVERFWDPLCALIDDMRRLEFIRPDMSVDVLVAERVEDILPKLLAAAQAVTEAEKKMASVAAEKL
ncbi:MAG: TIGR00730 family Rossman fold protein [Xanthobacteraceae bacterium]